MSVDAWRWKNLWYGKQLQFIVTPFTHVSKNFRKINGFLVVYKNLLVFTNVYLVNVLMCETFKSNIYSTRFGKIWLVWFFSEQYKHD